MKTKTLTKILTLLAVIIAAGCKQQDAAPLCAVTVADNLPGADLRPVSGTLVFDEINTGVRLSHAYPLQAPVTVPVGVYNISGEIEAEGPDGTVHLKTAIYQYTVTADTRLSLPWIAFNPDNTLVFGEIYFTGSLNAKGTGGLYDTYFTIYNNTDRVLYADGLAIVESKLTNVTTDEILTPANRREANFTAQAVYVIPGGGTDVPVQPGGSIKIVDQAIDWNEHVPGALDHTDADFEWYDLSSSASVVDTDNPAVANLDKWFCYTLTIWIPSNQCNRSYALVRFPQGMTMERFLTEQKGEYDYVNAATGIEMHAQNAYLIKHEWIIDGVNLCPAEKFTIPALGAAIDRGYAAISDKNSDTARFGRKFRRKVSGTDADGHVILQDTDNSAADFEIVAAR